MTADRRVAGVRAFMTRGLTVLVYHEVTDRPSEFQRLSAGYVTSGVFERQMLWLRERFAPISPSDLPQLGGRGPLPTNAALVTFDDAWKGVVRTGLPILASLGIPALWFLNMGTVDGTPDLSAVRRFERMRRPDGRSRLDGRLDIGSAAAVLAHVEATYRDDASFLQFQGPTASRQDLTAAVGSDASVWLGSHLLHHWDLTRSTPELFLESARANAAALAEYPNILPAFATPYGTGAYTELAAETGAKLAFTARGAQNRHPDGRVLDRLQLEPEPSGPADWWWAAHRRRLLGSWAS
jgi:peptidoglycan/xylan/chitin deacetylase (PgdA/CDA1 family)